MVLGGVALCVLCAAVQDRRPRRADDALQAAIAQLIDEAALARLEGRLPSPQPDFASRFERAIDTAAARRAIIGRVHPDAFTDAYIRWQLTTVAMDIAPLDARDVHRLLREAPPLIENPRAEEATMALMKRAAEAGPLSPSDRERLTEFVTELDSRAAAAQALNGAALGFRDWVHVRLAGGASSVPCADVHWLIEQAAATVEAGWPATTIKKRLAVAVAGVALDDSIAHADRRTIADLLQRLAGRQRQFVSKVAFLADGSVRVSYSRTASITRREVDQLLQRLAEGREQR
jgi:hypothetical protein